MLSEIDTRPFPKAPPAFNLAGHVLGRAAALDKPALTILRPERDETLTYTELLRMTRGCATALLSRGLMPGDRVLLRLGNGLAFPILFLGAIWAGLVPVPTSAALTAAEITRLAALVAPRLVAAEPGIALPDHPAPVLTPDPARWAAQPPAELHLSDADREAYIIFTSGTSGSPMAVSHAHRAILARATMHQHWEGLTPHDRLLHAGALNWTYTLGTGLLDPWTLGATAVVPAAGTAPADLPALLDRARITIFAAAPGIFRQMLRTPFPPLPLLRHALSAGEALPDPVRSDWRRVTGCDIHEAFGMTEISTFLSGSPDRPGPTGTAGYVQPGRHVAVLGPDNTPVPRGEPGDLAVSTADPGLMRGYIGQPQQRGPWFRTGDAATMAADGAITPLGRRDDVLNAGGFRVSPVEVESAFLDIPGLVAAAAAEVEVRPGVRVIALFYEASCVLDTATLRQCAEKSLARWKQPRHYQRLDSLPRSSAGKLLRRSLAPAYRNDDP
ncbi:MAG: class I adenylate-forming enzyme family protein [Pseudomonadota bacterium]